MGTHTLYAAQLADGEVVKLSVVKRVAMTIAMAVGIMVLLSPRFIGVLKATHSIGVALVIFGFIGWSLAYFLLRNHFKARRVFDKP
jgi:ABC-type sulfate transport system permease component